MANDGTYGYDSAAAQMAEDRVESAANNLRTSVQELSTQLQTLAGSWDGEEQRQYSGIHQKVSDGFEQITDTLTQIKAALNENTNAVSAMRHRVQNTISGGNG